MGYYSNVSGRIEIKPVVPFSKLRQLISKDLAKPLGDKYYRGDRSAQVEYQFSNEFSPSGTITIYEGLAIVGAYEESYKAYTLHEDVQEIVNILGAETHQFLGHLEIEGEGYGSGEPDLWRLKVKGGKVQEIRPKLVWPED